MVSPGAIRLPGVYGWGVNLSTALLRLVTLNLLLKHHYSVAERPICIASSHCPESLEKCNTISPVGECERPKRRRLDK